MIDDDADDDGATDEVAEDSPSDSTQEQQAAPPHQSLVKTRTIHLAVGEVGEGLVENPATVLTSRVASPAVGKRSGSARLIGQFIDLVGEAVEDIADAVGVQVGRYGYGHSVDIQFVTTNPTPDPGKPTLSGSATPHANAAETLVHLLEARSVPDLNLRLKKVPEPQVVKLSRFLKLMAELDATLSLRSAVRPEIVRVVDKEAALNLDAMLTYRVKEKPSFITLIGRLAALDLSSARKLKIEEPPPAPGQQPKFREVGFAEKWDAELESLFMATIRATVEEVVTLRAGRQPKRRLELRAIEKPDSLLDAETPSA